MVPGAISLKLVVLLSFLICAVLIGWFAIPEKGPSTSSGGNPSTLYSPSILHPPSSLAALTFFAWNPLVLMQGPGNGHNDMVFMALMVLGIVLWRRKLWWGTALALTLATLAKVTALLMIPLFGVVLFGDGLSDILRAWPDFRSASKRVGHADHPAWLCYSLWPAHGAARDHSPRCG
jgi:hypothetical protein